MKKKIAILLIIPLTIMAILVLGYGLWQRGLFYEEVKKEVVRLLGERFGVEMVVGKVQGSLLSDILLTDVCIKNPDRPGEEIPIQGVRLRYNLWKIMTRREGISGLSRIELIRPDLQLLRDKEGRWSWSEQLDKLFERGEVDYIPEILIKEGRLGACDEAREDSLSFNKVTGLIKRDTVSLKLGEGEIRWRRIGEPLRVVGLAISLNKERLLIENLILGYKGIEFSCRGDIQNLKERELGFEVVTNVFNLKALSDLFGKECLKNYLQRVNIEGQLKFKGEIRYPKDAAPSLDGEMVFTSKTLPSIFVRVSYRDPLLSLSPLLIEDSRMTGVINLEDGPVDLKLIASRLDPRLISLFIGRRITCPYLIDGEITIQGPIEEPLIKGGVRFIPTDPKTRIKDLKIAFFREGSRLGIDSFQFAHQKGLRLSLKGISQEYPRDYSLNMAGNLYLPVGGHQLVSKVEFDGKIRSILSNPYLTGSLNLTGVSIDGERIGDFLHQIRYHKSVLSILTPSPASSGHISGEITLSPTRLNLVISPDNLELKPLLAVVGLPDIEGRMAGSITVKGEAGPELQVDGQDLKIKETNLLGRSSGLLSFSAKGDTVDLLGLELRQSDGGVLSAFGRLWLGKEPSLNLTANCEALRVHNGLIRSRFKAEGGLSKFRISGSLTRVERGSSFDIQGIRGKIGLVEGKMMIHSLAAKVGRQGELYIRGSYPLTGNVGGLDFHLKRFQWQEMPWNQEYFKDWEGEMDISGKFWRTSAGPGLSAHLGPVAVRIRQDLLKEFSGELNYEGGKVRLRLNPTPNLHLEGEIIPSRSMLNLKTKIREERFSILTKFLPLSLGGFDGLVKGEVMIEQDWRNPLVRGNLSIDPSGGETEGLGQVKIKFLIKDKIFSTDTFHIQQPAGHLTLERCQIGPLPAGSVNLLAELVDFKLPGPRLTGKVVFDGLLKTGSVRLEGRLSSSSLWINRRYEFKNLATRSVYDSTKGLTFSPLEAETTLAGLIDTSKKARLSIKGLKILQGKRELALLEGDLDLEKRNIDIGMKVSKVDLNLLFQHLKAVEEAEGLGNASLHLKGGFASPDLSGEISAEARRLKIRYIVDELRDFETKIVIDKEGFTIERLHAKAGKSKLRMISRKKIAGNKMDLSIQTGGHPLKVNIPDFIQAGILANLHLTGSYDSPVCTGEIELYNARFTYPPPGNKTLVENELFDWIDWDLKLIARKGVRYYNDYVDVELKDGSWISVRGRGQDRRVGGLAWARAGRGKISFLGREFVIGEAELRFEEDKRPPFIFGTAKALVSGMEVTLTHNGRLFEAEPVLAVADSYPAKTREEIVRILRFGRDYSKISEEDSRTLLRIGMIRLASGQLSSSLIRPLERRLGNLLNMDLDIKTPIVEHLLSNSSQAPLADTEVSLGNYISDDLYFNYQAKILEKTEREKGLKTGHSFGLEYQFPGEESIQYEIKTDESLKEEEQKIMLKKELQF